MRPPCAGLSTARHKFAVSISRAPEAGDENGRGGGDRAALDNAARCENVDAADMDADGDANGDANGDRNAAGVASERGGDTGGDCCD